MKINGGALTVWLGCSPGRAMRTSVYHGYTCFFGVLINMKYVNCMLAIMLWGCSSSTLAGPPPSHPTGLIFPTPEEEAKLPKRNIIVVRPNSLSIQRASNNQQVSAASSSMPAAASPAEELVIETAPPTSAPPMVPGGGMKAASTSSNTASSNTVSATLALPTRVDNSELPAFPPVGDQVQEQSCGSFSTTYYTLSHETCLARGCDNKAGTQSATVFSPKWTYNMINNGADNGSMIENAFNLFFSNGAVSWAQFPYTGSIYDVTAQYTNRPAWGTNVTAWDTNPSHWLGALSYRIASHFSTLQNLDTPAGLTQLKQLLANGHVVNYVTFVYSWKFTKILSGSHSGEQAATYATPDNLGGHAMTVVGYDDTVWIDVNGNGTQDAGETGALLVVNSWGIYWKNKGFSWVAYDALQTNSKVQNGPTPRSPIFFRKQVHSITARPPYTPTLVAELDFANVSNRSSISLNFSQGTSTFQVGAFQNQGGAFNFGGSGGSVSNNNGKFYFDLTDLIPKTPGPASYSLSVYGQPKASLSLFQIIEPSTAQSVSNSGLTLVSTTKKNPLVSTLVFNSLNYPPVVVVKAGTPTYNTSTNSAVVQLDGSGSYDRNGAPLTSYSWDFGDNSNSLTGSSTVNHTYTSGGPYTATLTVKNQQNAVASGSAVIRLVPPTVPPTGVIKANSRVVSGQPVVTLDGTGSYNTSANETITSYIWSFGDGTNTASGSTQTHTYRTPGAYTVQLTVTNSKAISQATTLVIQANTISPPSSLSATLQ